MEGIAISLIVLMFLINFIVDLKNYTFKDQPVPKNVEGIYDEKKYETWKNYTMSNFKLNMFEHILSTLVLILLLMFKVFNIFETWSSSIFSHVIVQNLFFMFCYIILYFVVRLPFKYISTFKIEETYGFNKTTKKTFITDQIKSFLMIVILGGATLSLIHLFYLRLGSKMSFFALSVWGALTLIMLIIFLLNTKVFIKIFYKLRPLEAGSLRDRIGELASKLGFSIHAISVIDASRRSTKLNAFFSGIGKTREVVLFDTLIEKMSEEEILAVLAHELGHATHKDVPRMLVQQILMIGIYVLLFSWIMQNQSLFEAFGFTSAHLGFGLILFMIFIEPISFILGMFTNALSRKAEYKADHFACQHTSKEYMKSALIKLFQENLSNLNPHPLYVLVHYSHPEASKRLYSIENYTQEI